MSRRFPVVTLPTQETDPTKRLREILHRVMGFLSALVCIDLVRDAAGVSVVSASAPGTDIPSSRHTVDWNDAGVDEFRLTGYANDATSAGLVVQYAVNSAILASATVPAGGAADFTGAWTHVTTASRAAIAGDQVGSLKLVGGGASATLYGVQIQARTVNRAI